MYRYTGLPYYGTSHRGSSADDSGVESAMVLHCDAGGPSRVLFSLNRVRRQCVRLFRAKKF